MQKNLDLVRQLDSVKNARTDLRKELQNGPANFNLMVEALEQNALPALVSLHMELMADQSHKEELDKYRIGIITSHEIESLPPAFFVATLPLVSTESNNSSEKLFALLCKYLATNDNKDHVKLRIETIKQQKSPNALSQLIWDNIADNK